MTLAKEAGTIKRFPPLCVHISIYLYEILCVCIHFVVILARELKIHKII